MTIDANLFAHIENDSSLSGTFKLEGNRFSRTVEYLNNYLTLQSQKKPSLPPGYEVLLNQLKYLVAIEQKLESMSHTLDINDKVNLLARSIAEDVMKMPADSKILIPGGWRNSSGGHAMVYEFVPQIDGFKFSVTNAGAGLKYHAKKSRQEKELYNPQKTWKVPTPDSPKSKAELILFIEQLLRARLSISQQKQNKPITEKVLYEEILPSISYINGSEIDANSDIPNHAFTGGQLSGTCSQRCIHQMIKILTPSEKDYQKFIFDFKQHALYEYATSCMQHVEPYNEAVADQIRLAIENNLKILNAPGLFTEERIDEELKNISDLEIKLKETPFDVAPPKTNTPPKSYSLKLYANQSKIPQIQLDQHEHGQALPPKINLGDGTNLLRNLDEAVRTIGSIQDQSARYVYLEHLILQLPLNPVLPNNPDFYRELVNMNDFGLFKTRLNDIQTILLKLQLTWLKKEHSPAVNMLLLSLTSLQMDFYTVIPQGDKIPSFKPLSDAIMYSMVGNQQRNPFYATNNPILDKRLKDLQSRYNRARGVSLFEYHNFLSELVQSEPRLNEELNALYDKEFAQNITELHEEIRKAGLKSLFLIARHYENKTQNIGTNNLGAKFEPIITKVVSHMEHESKLRKAINPLYENKYLSTVWFRLSIDYGQFRVSSPLFPSFVPNEKLLNVLPQSKYSLNDSPAKDALTTDSSDRGPLHSSIHPKTANFIQLTPAKTTDNTQMTSNVTQADITARDYLHLRSEPALQIALTLDYFKRNIEKLSDESNQRYVEANLFQPGLLLDALATPQFLPQLDGFLKTGLKFFSQNGQHQRESLLFLRLDFLVSHYMLLNKNPKGLVRLKSIQNDLEKQLSLPNNPEVTYVLQQYLFLNLVARMEQGEQSEELFSLAYQAYNYINSHTNPLILEDKIHRLQVDCAMANFKLIIRQQPEEQLTKIIKKTVLQIEKQPEEEITISGRFPIFTIWNKKTSTDYQLNALKGIIYEQGLARSGVPFTIQNHPLIREQGLNDVKECLMNVDETYMIFPDEQQEIRLFYQNDNLTVQKFWTINGKKEHYELQALTKDHEAQHANKKLKKIIADLPPILKDGTMNYWSKVSDPAEGLFVQNNIPVFAHKTVRIGADRLMSLDEKGCETGEQLAESTNPLLQSMESSKFQLNLTGLSNTLIKLPRYNLNFEDRQGTLYNLETGEQIIASPPPIDPSVAGIVLASKEQQHYMVPVARFYATEDNAQTSDFYPVVHDISGTIAKARLQNYLNTFPTTKKPLWHYPNSERHVLFQIKDGELIADSVSDALYLAYIYMATNRTEKAWNTLEECTTRFGGLTGDPAELQFISWICRDMPFILPSEASEYERNKPKRNTPPYVACQLKATSLLCDYTALNGAINLKNTKPLDGTANAVYDSLNQKDLEQFQTSLPETIYSSFTRLQTMGRHLEHTYILSTLERKRLLSYYHQSQAANHGPQGALGFEWLSLSLEALLAERESLLARQTADNSLSPADTERLRLIQNNLDRLKPVVAKSSVLEQIPLDLSLPESKYWDIKKGHLNATTTAAMENWMHRLPGDRVVSPPIFQLALNELSSTMSDDAFIINLPKYLQIASLSNEKQKKELYDFCSQTLIAKRHIPLKDQESNIPFLCNLLYRLLTSSNEHIFKHNTWKFKELILSIRNQSVKPLMIYEARDVYKDILATPEQIMTKRERPAHTPLKATCKELPSLLAQTKIEKHLSANSKKQLQSLIAQYKKLEQESETALNDLAETLDKDLDKTFVIEEQAGTILFEMELQKRELTNNLIQNATIIDALITATEKAEPILKSKIEKTWQKALELANQGPDEPQKARTWAIEKKSKARPTLTQSDLLALYSQADFACSVEKTGLSLDNAQLLHNAIHKALIHGIQYQSLEKITKDLLKASTTNEPNIAAQALDILARTEIPGLDEPSVVILQHEEQILLRKRQSSALQSLLMVLKDGNRVNETIEKIVMGGGKSKVILPILAEKKAQGDNLVVIEVPNALLATNHVDLNSTSQRLFGKRAYRFDFDRDSDCSPQRLEQIYNLFIEIMNTRSYLVTTGEAVQSLELKYLELLLSEETPNAEWKQQVYWCDKITNLFRHHTDCIIDEVHQGLSLKKKLNYTFGSPKPISPSLIKHATALFGFIDLNIIRDAPSFDEHYDWSPFKTDLATKLINDSDSPLTTFVSHSAIRFGNGAQKELIAYLTNSATAMPESVLKADEEVQEALGFFKQEINVRLPQTATQILGKHYGASKRKDMSAIEKTLAIPYAGTNVPNERNRYQDELEAINKTIQMMLLKGISKNQLIERIAEWEALAREELFNLPATPEHDEKATIDDTPTAKGFVLLTQGLGLRFSQIDSKNADQMNELHQRLKSNLPLIFDILREFSLRQIMQDSGILSSDNFNHAAQYRSVQGISGTPPLNDSAYHQRLKYDKAPSLGSDGYIFEVIRNKKTAVTSCDNQETYQFIHDVLSRSNNRQQTRAFIDIRGAFTGVNNYQVAQQIARYIKAYPQHFSNPMKQVLYFNEDQILCAIDINHPEQPIELGTSEINELNRLLDTNPKERFTLFDQIHTIGTDIKQFNKAHAIVFVDDKTNMQEFLQGTMRERELELNQTIELIVPGRMNGVALDDLGKQFKKNDKQSVTADAPAAAQGQMRNHIRRQFLNLIQDLPSEDAVKKAALTQHFRPLFEDKPSLDLFALYGGINKKQAITEILEHYKNQMQNLWESRLKSASVPPFAEDIKKMSYELQAIIEKAIPFCLAEYDVSDKSFNAEVEVQKEVQKEVQIELLTLNETYKPGFAEANTKNWPGNIGYSSFFNNEHILRHFSLNLNEICIRTNQAPDIFSARLFGSKNYAQTYYGQEEYTGAFLKPVFLVWYHRYQGKLNAMIVTPQEAIELGARIESLPDSWIATTQDTVVAGNQAQKITEDPEYQELREQIRFFNGEFSSISNQESGLLWLNVRPVQKLDFFEQNLLPYRPGNQAKLHQLKTALTQAKSEGFAYIAKHPFDDLTHFNWDELYSDILPAQSIEYQKLAKAFLHINQNWESKDIQIMELQQTYSLPMNSLTYIDNHLNNLKFLKGIVKVFQPTVINTETLGMTPFLAIINSFSPQQKAATETLLGMSIEEFYKSHQCKPLQNSMELWETSRYKEISILSLDCLKLLNTYPALKGKNYFGGYLISIAKIARSKEELAALINTVNPEEKLLKTIIKNDNFEEDLLLPILQAATKPSSALLKKLAAATKTNKYIDTLLEQEHLNETVFIELLKKQFLTETQLLKIISTAPYVTLPQIVRYPTSSTAVQDAILQHPSLDGSMVNELLMTNTYSNSQLLFILRSPLVVNREIIKRVLNQKNLDEPGLLEIIKHPLTYSEILGFVFAHPASNPELRKQVLIHKDLSEETIERIIDINKLSNEEFLLLINNSDPAKITRRVIYSILAEPALDETVLLAIITHFKDDAGILYDAYMHSSFNEHVCHALLQSPNLTPFMILRLLPNKFISENDLLLILNNPSACNEEVRVAMLKRLELKFSHLSTITKNCQSPRLLEQIFNHPSANTKICEEVLKHHLLTPTIIMNLMQNRDFSANELLLIFRHPIACNEKIRHVLLQNHELNAEHLLEILQKCDTGEVVERVYNHPAANSQVREQLLQHPLIPSYLLLNYINNKTPTDNELMLMLSNPVVHKETSLLQELYKFPLNEEQFNELLNNHANKQLMNFVYNHPSVTPEIRQKLLMHHNLPAGYILRMNKLTDNELLILLQNHVALDPVHLNDISKKPSIGYQVLLALITHVKTDNYILSSVVNHRNFDLNTASIILQREEIPHYLLLQIAQKTLNCDFNGALWEQCIELIINTAEKNNMSTELNKLFETNLPRISTKLSLKLLAFLGKEAIESFPLTGCIQKATKDDFDALIALPKNYSGEELIALSKRDLTSEQIDNLLAHQAMTSIVADELFKKTAYSGTINTWDWLSEDQLLNTIDNTKDYNSLTLALRHGSLLSESRLNEWMESKREQHCEYLKYGQISTKIEIKLLCTLEDLRLKSLSHAIKAVKDPSYEAVARTSFNLYQDLHKEIKLFVVDPIAKTEAFKKNCRQAINQAEPVLQNHRGYKQFFMDFINVIFAITALFRNGNWRLFETKTDSMNKVNNVLHTMDQLIEKSNKNAIPSAG